MAVLKPRWLFFAYFAFRATSIGRFSSVFYLDRGLTPSQMGVIFSIDALTSVACTPFFTARVDRQLAAGNLLARERSMRASFMVTVVVFCFQSIVDLGLAMPGLPLPPFGIFLVCRFVMSVAFSPCMSVMNAHTLAFLGGDKARFGEERLYGAVSWAITNMLLGLAMDRFGSWVMFVGTAVNGVAAIAVLSATAAANKHRHLPSTQNVIAVAPADSKRSSDTASISSCQLLQAYASNAQSCSFFFAIMCLGVGMSLVENLLFLLFVEDLGSSNTLCGLSVVVTVIFEIPILRSSKWLLDRCGIRTMFSVGLVCYIIRALGYTICPNGWCVIAFEPLHGVTFGCCYLAAVQYVAIITPEGMLTTGQGLMSSIQTGVGYFMGTLGGGFVIQVFGEKVMYRGAATLVLVGLAAFRLWGSEETVRLSVRGLSGGNVKVDVSEDENEAEAIGKSSMEGAAREEGVAQGQPA